MGRDIEHSHVHSHHHHGHGGGHMQESCQQRADTTMGRTTTEEQVAEAKRNQRKLRRATVFVLMFFLVEIVGGLWSKSLAIVSDAAHLLADVSAFILAMVANEMAMLPASDKLTYGPVRAEVLSALFSTVIILVLSLLLVYSAIGRLIEFSRGGGEDVDGRIMSLIALLGLLVNIILLFLLGADHGGDGHNHSHGHSRGHHVETIEPEELMEGALAQHLTSGEQTSLVESNSTNNYSEVPLTEVSKAMAGDECACDHSSSKNERQEEQRRVCQGDAERGDASAANINIQGALLHAVTDLIQSAGVLLAGLLIWYNPDWKWVDPIATLFFVALVMYSTRELMDRAFNVLLEGVPDNIDYENLRRRLSGIEGVTDVHCLHVWSLTLGRPMVSAHMKAMEPEKALAAAHLVCESMGVIHSTIQVQVDTCKPATCVHPCVSTVNRCCKPEAIDGSSGLLMGEACPLSSIAAS